MSFNQSALIVFLGALTFDLLIAEPPEPIHPVVWMGKAITWLKKQLISFGSKRTAGLAIALILAVSSGGLSYIVFAIVGRLWQPGGLLMAIYLFKSTFSLSALLGSGRRIAEEVELDPNSARHRLPILVGRDPSSLNAAEMRSALVESIFENLADSFTAPLFFFLAGLPAGIGFSLSLSLSYKAVNTMDSMIGYKIKELSEIGFVAAKLDDILNFIPARLTAVFISLAGFSLRGLRSAFKDHSRPASPNSGWPMSAASGVLGVQLKKTEHYILGAENDLPELKDIKKALELAKRCVVLIVILSIVFILAPGVDL